MMQKICFLQVTWHPEVLRLYLLQAADLDGEINLATCCDITDFPVQRNYGFQIHVSTPRTCDLHVEITMCLSTLFFFFSVITFKIYY